MGQTREVKSRISSVPNTLLERMVGDDTESNIEICGKNISALIDSGAMV